MRMSLVITYNGPQMYHIRHRSADIEDKRQSCGNLSKSMLYILRFLWYGMKQLNN